MPNSIGFYDEIPVLHWQNNLDGQILVIDAAKVVELGIQFTKIEFRLFRELKEDTLKKYSDQTERQLQLSVWIQVSEKLRVKLTDKRAAVKLPVKALKATMNQPP